MQNILILGTGKMARNIGLFFLRQDCAVCWVSRASDRAESFQNKLVKDIRRLALVLDKESDDFNVDVADISYIPLKKYDLILESIEEDLTQKQEVIKNINPLLTSDTILTSNSSSILPNQIHNSAIGLHFFYPVELTGLVEVITNSEVNEEKIKQLINQLKSWGIHTIIQNNNNAFAINRLLLPMQAEAFRLLQAGYPVRVINECSKSDQIKIGQLELMDSIGFDVLLPAIRNYVSRMSAIDQKNYEGLITGLEALIKIGKLGKKNGNGLLAGDPLPWQLNDPCLKDIDPLKQRFSQIFINTCQRFLESAQIKKEELKNVLDTLFS